MNWNENYVDIWQKNILDDGSHRCVQGPARRQDGRSRVSPERVWRWDHRSSETGRSWWPSQATGELRIECWVWWEALEGSQLRTCCGCAWGIVLAVPEEGEGGNRKTKEDDGLHLSISGGVKSDQILRCVMKSDEESLAIRLEMKHKRKLSSVDFFCFLFSAWANGKIRQPFTERETPGEGTSQRGAWNERLSSEHQRHVCAY